MFRTFSKRFLPNPLDRMLEKTAKRGGRKILLGWNRGLGDIALGLYAIVHRIREIIPDAEITFLTRENLKDGFSMLEGVQVLIEPSWKRGEDLPIDTQLKKKYDLVIHKPSPTDWVPWQRATLTPRLKWNKNHEKLFENFGLSEKEIYVGMQVSAETNYGLWRNWPFSSWQSLIHQLEEMNVKVLLFGFGSDPKITNSNVIDLRGKTKLFDLLSIVKNRVHALVLPDSGISSMVYYLDEEFPLKHVTLWADPNHGILKQKVSSPNSLLKHCPLISELKDLSTVKVGEVIETLFPPKNTGAIVLAGGQGSRLGFQGPKGLFEIAGKTLFQWKCEKMVKGAPLAIMTSPKNHEETVRYFEKNGNFGLEIYFFCQEMQRFLDEKQKPMDLKGPDGNGGVFSSFVRAGLDSIFEKKGIDSIVVSNIENPLSHPLDPPLSFLSKAHEVVIQCIKKDEADHPMGMVEIVEGKAKVVEYMHLDPKKEYLLAYSGQMAFSISFFLEVAKKDLPLHWVQKKMHDRWLSKGEKFIFDSLEYAQNVKVFCSDRKTCYAPVKTTENIPYVEKFLR